MLKTATDFLPSSGFGLPLALGGSLLLHLGLLFGVPAMTPATPGTTPSLSVHLVSAAQTVTHDTRPTTPSAAQPRPEHLRLQHHAAKVVEMQTQAALPAVRFASTAPPHKASAQPRIVTNQTEHVATVYQYRVKTVATDGLTDSQPELMLAGEQGFCWKLGKA